MKLRLLGTAAGGGSPQWNCACEQCTWARHSGVSRTQECALISADGQSWYLLNASPDIRVQLLGVPELVPSEGRNTPLRGVMFTDGELDHTLGLFSLREAASLDVYSTESVRNALHQCLPVKAMAGAKWHIGFTPPGLSVTSFVVGDKRPRYAEGCEGNDWVVGLRMESGEQTVVYAPCFGAWSDVLDDAIKGADVAIIDGTFLTADEMPSVKGHLSIQESLPHLIHHKGTRFIFTHLNNTNPLLTWSSS